MHISTIDLRGLISRSNTGLPRAKKDAKYNSSLVPWSNTILWLWLLYSKSVRDLIQWSLHLRGHQALSSTLASLGMLQPRAFRSLKMHRVLGPWSLIIICVVDLRERGQVQ